MEKEIWIEKVMKSSKDMKSLEPSDSIWQGIQGRVSSIRESRFSSTQILGIAAGIALLIAVNVSLIWQSRNTAKTNENSTLLEQFDGSSNDILNQL